MHAPIDLLWGAPVWSLLGFVALAMLALYALGRGRSSILWATLLRVLAAAGIMIPGMIVLGWYRQLEKTQEWAQALPVEPALIAERFVVQSTVLLTAGFVLLVAGIFLARRLPDRPSRE